MRVQVGDKVYIPREKRPYRVMARDSRYIICTKPFLILFYTSLLI